MSDARESQRAGSARPRRRILSVIGSGSTLSREVRLICLELGAAAVDEGFRIACGGRDGVMAAVAEGAHASSAYREGDVIGILPSYDATNANAFIDIVIPTGMGITRNVIIVSMADVVVAVAGGSGTLSEIALAWQLHKPIVAIAPSGGWSEKLADTSIDDRRRNAIIRATSGREAVDKAKAAL